MSKSITLGALLLACKAYAQLFPDCVHGPLRNNTVCDPTATPWERAKALTAVMNVSELISVSGNPTGNYAVPVARLGLPNYWWWNEALHGVAASPGSSFNPNHSAPFGYATSFPQPILMSAAFDDQLIHDVATVVSTEGRAWNNYANNATNHAGLDFWTPNINTFRDPRWGRGQETPGEDPVRTSAYIRQLIPGLQGGINPKYPRVAATCKHYAGYDMENSDGTTRYAFNALISTQDLAEYYMPPFEACVRDSNVIGIMCSYNAINGVPACASPYLLQTVLRDFWGFPDEAHYVTSDCDAVGNEYTDHRYTLTAANASALSLIAGTDYDCGSTYNNGLQTALNTGLVNLTTLQLANNRRYSVLAKLGYFDPAEMVPWRSLGWADVSTPASEKLAYTAAAEGIVLLKNDGLLPLKATVKKPLKVAIIDGCWGNATSQLQGNYAGTAPYLISPIAALQAQPNVKVLYAQAITGGCATSNMGNMNTTANVASDADVLVYIGGIDESVESEARDRNNITWPGAQQAVITSLANYGKPIVVFQMGGGQVDSQFIQQSPLHNALIWAGYPGQSGGQAMIDVLFGKVAPAGRLTASMYPVAYASQVQVITMGLRPNITGNLTTNNPGRTYMWYNGTVYPFGYGLHYTTFTATNLAIAGPDIHVAFPIADLLSACKKSKVKYMDQCPFRTASVTINNKGGYKSDYSVLAFISGQHGPTPYPIKRLATYTRLFGIGTKGSKSASLPITLGMLARFDDQGRKVLYPGTYNIEIDTTPALASITFTLSGAMTVLEEFPMPPAPIDQPGPPVLALKPLPAGYTELGCYNENSTNNGAYRYLPYAAYTGNNSNTPTGCALTCTAAGYNVSGAEYGSQCYCGTIIPPAPAPAASCNMACTGDPYQPCGGTWLMEVAVHNGTMRRRR